MIVPGPVPRYRQLAAILRTAIESGELAPGTPVPSKRTTRERFGVSGETYDKAVAILKAEGLLRTSAGLGHFVVPEDERPGPG